MLWSASVINGYSIAASDGRVGVVSDFLFDDDTWKVRWLVVDTGKWLSGRKVLLPPSILGRIDPEKREFSVEVTMHQVRNCPGIDTDRPVSRQMETNIYDYYGWSPYWGNGLFTNGYGYVGSGIRDIVEHLADTLSANARAAAPFDLDRTGAPSWSSAHLAGLPGPQAISCSRSTS
jgi:hypothetical protein